MITKGRCDAVMGTKVALIRFRESIYEAFERALQLIGGINDLNTAERPAIIKVGVFDPNAENHTSIRVADAIVRSFSKAPNVFLVESDNYKGKALDRLQIWKELFSSHVVPFSLSDDLETKKLNVAGEEVGFSHILFKPNVFVSTHILRSYERGSVLKNLLGLVPDSKKARFHKKLDVLLADIYEAIGGIDLAVLDGTYLYRGASSNPHVSPKNAKDRNKANALIVGRDAVAVEAVGAVLAGLKPQEMPVIQEFVRRSLGEGDLKRIDIVGASFEDVRENFACLLRAQRRVKRNAVPQTWGGQVHLAMKSLMQESFFSSKTKRTARDVTRVLEAKGILPKGKEDSIKCMLTSRVKKGILKTEQCREEWVYWAG